MAEADEKPADDAPISFASRVHVIQPWRGCCNTRDELPVVNQTVVVEGMRRLVDYQDDLVTPGSSPAWAISRRQIRHRPNFLYTECARPHR